MASSVHSKAILSHIAGDSRKDDRKFQEHRRLYNIPMKARLKARYDYGVRMGTGKARTQ